MRDVLEASGIVDHPPAEVWRILGAPELYSRFVPEISWCEVVDRGEAGRGPRYLIRVCPQRDVVHTAHIDAVVYRPGTHVVWAAAHNDQHWVSVELQPHGRHGCELLVQVMLPGVDDASLRYRLDDTVRRIGRYLAGRPARGADLAAQREDARTSTAASAATLIRAGVLGPGRPDKVARQLGSLTRWGLTVTGAYRSAAARSPGVVALHDERGARTYLETVDRADRLANGLAGLGVTAGQPVALLCRNHAVMVESIIACGSLGADVVLLNPGLSAQSVGELIHRYHPVAVLADDEFGPVVADAPGTFAKISTWPGARTGFPTVDELIAGAPDTPLRPTEQPGRIVVLTSGTTGVPKGARRPTPRGLRTAAALLARIPLRVGERIFVAAPLFHTWGLAGLQLGMTLRGTLSLRRRFDAEETLSVLAEQRCTALFAVPIMLRRILDLPERVRSRYDLSALRIVASSGSALGGPFVTAFMDAFGDILYNMYGSTEVSWVSVADPIDLRAAPTTAGRCPPGTQIGVLDEAGHPVPPGAAGDLYVGNEMLFDGYTEGGSLPMAHRLMFTGDRGYLDADGRLFVTGRGDEMIVSGGENVFPRPVEEALLTLPQVRDVAVVGVPDAEFGQRLAAYVVLREGATLEASAVCEHVRQRLARFAVPRDVFFVPDLPRSATGKVLKRLLTEESWPLAPDGTRHVR